MNRQTRKQLKTDSFAKDLGMGVSFLSEHRTETIRYGLIALGVVILGVGYYFYSSHQATAREAALTEAMKIDESIISPSPTPTNINFPTQAEKDKARTQAFTDLFIKYRGTAEGATGGIFIGAEQSDKGNFAAAEKIFKDVMDSSPADYASEARISLAHVYAAEGKTQEAENLMHYLIDHPTDLVSKEEATLELGDIIAQTNPSEAVKLIGPLRNSPRASVSKVALSEVGRITTGN